VRVKICGIMRISDAEAAAEAGADAVGFVLWPGSPRCVTVEQAASLASVLPDRLQRAGVFVNEPADTLRASMQEARLTVAQLHGDESPEYCRGLDLEWYKAFRVDGRTEAASLEQQIARYPAPVFMLDTGAGETGGAREFGGSGRPFDWKLAARISMRTAGIDDHERRRMILAGGLDASNVALAIKLVRPWEVDVSTGVESSPGVKDHDLIRRFVRAVRSVA